MTWLRLSPGNYLSFLLKVSRDISLPLLTSNLNAIYFLRRVLCLCSQAHFQNTVKTSNKYTIARTKRHNYRKENLSTISKTPLNEEIYVRLEMQMHASTHATMLRRQLTFKPKTKKIKFLGRRKVVHATCDGWNFEVRSTKYWIFRLWSLWSLQKSRKRIWIYEFEKIQVFKVLTSLAVAPTNGRGFSAFKEFSLDIFWLNRQGTEIFDAFDNQVISISEVNDERH